MLWFQSCLNSRWRAPAKHKFCCSRTQVPGLHTRLSRGNVMFPGLTQVKVGEAVVPSGLPLCESMIHINLAQSLFFGKLFLPCNSFVFSTLIWNNFLWSDRFPKGNITASWFYLMALTWPLILGLQVSLKASVTKTVVCEKTFDTFKIIFKNLLEVHAS